MQKKVYGRAPQPEVPPIFPAGSPPPSSTPSMLSIRPASLQPSAGAAPQAAAPQAKGAPAPTQGSRFTFGGRLACPGLSVGTAASASEPPASRLSSISLFPTARRPDSKTLCPCLVVPEGMELVFAVRDMLSRNRQQVSFSVVDLEGAPLSHVIVNEVGQHCGILIQMLDQTPLAWVRTQAVHERGGMPEICYPSGEVFCAVAREDAVPTGRYTLRDQSGQRLYTFHGDFREKAVNVVSSSGRLVCDTERCNLGFDASPHYQVRVAPTIDAGLILCGLLAVEKLESGVSTPRSGRPTTFG